MARGKGGAASSQRRSGSRNPKRSTTHRADASPPKGPSPPAAAVDAPEKGQLDASVCSTSSSFSSADSLVSAPSHSASVLAPASGPEAGTRPNPPAVSGGLATEAKPAESNASASTEHHASSPPTEKPSPSPPEASTVSPPGDPSTSAKQQDTASPDVLSESVPPKASAPQPGPSSSPAVPEEDPTRSPGISSAVAAEKSGSTSPLPEVVQESRSASAFCQSDDEEMASLGARGAAVTQRLASFDREQTYAAAVDLFPTAYSFSPSFPGNNASNALATQSFPPPVLPDCVLESDTASLFENVDDETNVEALRKRLHEAEFWFKKLRGDLFLWMEKAVSLQARLGDAAKVQASQAFAVQELRREKRTAERQTQKERDSSRRERETLLQEIAALKQDINQLKSRAAGADAAVRAAARVAAETNDERSASGEAGDTTGHEGRAADKAAVVSLTASVAALKTERDGLIGELYYERRKHQEVAEALEQAKHVCESEHVPNLEKLRASLDASEAERHEIQSQLIQYKIKYAESAFEELGARQQAMQQGIQHMHTVQQMRSLQLEVASLTSPRGLRSASPRGDREPGGTLSRHNSPRGSEESHSFLSRVCAALSPRGPRETRGHHDSAPASPRAPPSPRPTDLAHGGEVDGAFVPSPIRSAGGRGSADIEGGAASLVVQAPWLAGSVIRSPRGPLGPAGGSGPGPQGLAGAFAAVAPLASPRVSVDDDVLPSLSPRNLLDQGGAGVSPPSRSPSCGLVQNPDLEDQVLPLTSRMSGVPKVPPLRLGDFQERLRDAGPSSPGGVFNSSRGFYGEGGGEGKGLPMERHEHLQHASSWVPDTDKGKGHGHEKGWKETVTGTTRKWFGKLNRLTSRRTGEDEKKHHPPEEGTKRTEESRNLHTVSEAAMGAEFGARDPRMGDRARGHGRQSEAEPGKRRVGRSASAAEYFSSGSSSRSSCVSSLVSQDSSLDSDSRRSSMGARSRIQSFDLARPNQPEALSVETVAGASRDCPGAESGENASQSQRQASRSAGEGASSSRLAKSGSAAAQKGEKETGDLASLLPRTRGMSLKGLARWGSSGGSLSALWGSALAGKEEAREAGDRSPASAHKAPAGENAEGSSPRAGGMKERSESRQEREQKSAARTPEDGERDAEHVRGRRREREGARSGDRGKGRDDTEASVHTLNGEEVSEKNTKIALGRRTTDPIEWLSDE
ncbi:conserved hypothetical protein [Neospora caninum Liverpool]|uniref:Uncharacterized protein n=1 Tax=Neospora caninum (strain Liverpool) TaxID=572307 RepID=F0VP39_NEOCL|nr:conserved hypothetical protein [Neospora caninum Liverpool]CBZ55485.1 conserved hypothetical protein [Neospora caninum Liverpool]CEL70221.1 TPA: hypothetical protein BN1204_059090 [Neospora caninum Liverpool]|eukprot:XP_003885513.1 conserved hypothetical protein [Neospora caninum Liverpool]